MKSLIKILFVPFFFFINFIACMPPCGSGNPLPFFDIKGIKKIFTSNASGLQTATNEEVNIKDFRMSISLEVTYYAFLQNSGYGAFACSPIENGYEGTTEKIEYIKITADKAYDDKHDANTSLNDLVSVGWQTSTQSLDEYLKDISFSQKGTEIPISLKTPPSKKQSLIFTIEYALTNGEKYISKSSPVVLF
jgi:hypothetical protein